MEAEGESEEAGGRTKDRLQPAGVSEDDKTINTIKDMSTRLLK